MTTLFNLFCPVFVSGFTLSKSVNSMIIISVTFFIMVVFAIPSFALSEIRNSLPLNPLGAFPVGWLLSLMGLNAISLVCFSYPVTTTLGFNLSLAVCLWLVSVIILLNKPYSVSCVLPSNSPSYLVFFLSVVECISILIRPITLCFRLLANMSAGHILLSLVCKISLWEMGLPLGLLELMVSAVQAFVFLMLIGVYLEEALTH